MKKEIIALFKKYPSSSFRSKDVAVKLNLFEDYEYSSVKAAIHKLSEEGFLSKTGKRYKLSSPITTNKLVGKLSITQGGYGFITVKDKKMNDIFIAERHLATAFDGDTVEVSLFAKQKGKNLEGQIVGIVKRKRSEIAGTLIKVNDFYFVEPDEQFADRDILIKGELRDAKVGDKVVVGNIIWDNPKQVPQGDILEVFGKGSTTDVRSAILAKEFNLKEQFPDQVLREAEILTSEIPLEEIKKRIDFRDKNVFTIDPEDAKDFDDALSIEELANGNLSIGVHIADVSHYVQRGTNLDKEALTRGNSVYLVGKVIPMLPEVLSNGICSLVPNQNRLTYSVIMELTKRGKVENYKIGKSIINSKRRFTYEEAQSIIENGNGDFTNELALLNKIAKTLRKKRITEGSIDFYTTEVKFDLDETGKPIHVIKKEIKDSNMLVEEYMLLANKIVAKHIAVPSAGEAKPFIYRIHDLPDTEKLAEFSKFVKSLGYSFTPSVKAKINLWQKLMDEIKGSEEEAVINELAIRSMSKAVYSADNIGHYGLGFKYYTHFTSPIRRYSDLLVHRMLDHYSGKKRKALYTYKDLEDMSDHLSVTERSAVDAERLSVKQKQVEYLKEFKGEEFKAIISGVAAFGLFVKITDILAEGLVKMRDLDDDYYIYDIKKYALTGRRTKKQYRLGDRISVKLIRVDQERSELDFIIID